MGGDHGVGPRGDLGEERLDVLPEELESRGEGTLDQDAHPVELVPQVGRRPRPGVEGARARGGRLTGSTGSVTVGAGRPVVVHAVGPDPTQVTELAEGTGGRICRARGAEGAHRGGTGFAARRSAGSGRDCLIRPDRSDVVVVAGIVPLARPKVSGTSVPGGLKAALAQ